MVEHETVHACPAGCAGTCGWCTRERGGVAMSSSTKIQAKPTRETSIIRAGQQRLKAKRKRGLMIGANFGSALDALWANRLRSLLTTLGVVIGVAAVIAVVILTQGATAFLNQSLTALG